MSDFIWDAQGRCLARILKGSVFDEVTGQRIGTAREQALYNLKGEFIGSLRNINGGGQPIGPLPKNFAELLR
ncbi:MAG: hypothetical protein JO273_05470 [Methylobacteriaceae bacterium]|nr:hypothetical protein [Methylobacteriaceae bacterium]